MNDDAKLAYDVPAAFWQAFHDKPGPRTDCLAVLMPMRCKSDLAGATFTDAFLKG